MTPLAADRGPEPQKAGRIDELFEAQAGATPEAVALVHAGRALTYRELDARADALAARLRELGVGPGVLVGVCMRRSPQLVAALLAVLKAGGAYLPLDPAYPSERLRYMLDDSGAALMLTDCGRQESLEFAGPVLDLAAARDGRLACAGEIRPSVPEGAAYVIYTSGSTGRPKGVVLGHTARALIDWARRAFGGGELARVAATTSVCFDPSVFEIFAPLCTGGTVVLKESGLEPFAPGEDPTMLNGVASMFAPLCRAGAVPDSVRVINVGGEPLSAALVRELYARTRVEAVYNHYGPTEATTCATVALVPPDVQADPPIGRPIAGAEIRLLDPQGRPVAPGEAGEIHIGGGGLALGYLNRPELTAERFVPSEWGRLYRTGDLGRWTSDGQLEFVARADEQVKIRGFRIELAEVESALERVPGVEGAVAAVRRNAGGRPELAAYVQSARPLSGREIRNELGAWLPDHMLPARITVLTAFPLTLSGKVDRNALAALAPSPATERGVESRIEEAIAEVFRDILGCEAVGPNDSFFDLGGDSLAGVNAALRLQELLGYEIPSALLHQAPTPRELAAALEDCPLDDTRFVVPLRAGGSERPLFCLSDLFGRPFSYLSLTRRLSPSRPILGLAPGPIEQAFVESQSIGELTQALAREVRRIQPDGPYLLAGYSSGGVLAFDLACALERQGAQAALILLDSFLWSGRFSADAVARWAARQARDAIRPTRLVTRLRRVRTLTRKLARSIAAPEAPPAWVPPSRAALAQALMSACFRYRPGRFHGPTLVVKAADRDRVDALADHDGRLGWRRALAGQVRIATVAGDHHSMMREPRVGQAAGEIAAFLDEFGLSQRRGALPLSLTS
jgi:amino acid adenylation domain-containing protein